MIVEYTKLKEATTQVIEFTKDYMAENNIDLRTSIAEDLSLVELDGYLYLEKFEGRFGLTLPKEAYDYVCPPEFKYNLIGKILHLFGLIIFLPVFILIYPFTPKNRKESMRKKIIRNKKRLTLGDLAASLAIGRFVKREDIKIELK